MHLHRRIHLVRQKFVARWPVIFGLVSLAVAVLLVELGVRDSTRGMSVQIPVPGVVAPLVEQLRSQPQRHIGGDEAGSVAAGVVFGRADDVSVADQQAFLDSGLWHLLAASGQNIALVASCCVLLARGVGAGRTTGGVIALAAIPLYVLVVGGGASIVRAGIMGMLVLVAWLAGRLADATQLVVVVATTICWIWPGAHRGLGMQLSFACVLALIIWAGPMSRWLHARGVPVWLAGAVSATLLCSLVTAPILQLRTGAAPLTGIVANLIAVPLAGAILMIGLAGSILSMLAEQVAPDIVSIVLLAPAGAACELLLSIARRAAALPAAQSSSVAVNIGIPGVLGSWVFLSGRLMSSVRRSRMRCVVGAAVAVCLLVGLGGVDHVPGSRLVTGARARPAAPGVLRIVVLDVGQGDATLIADGTAAVLVDTGPPDGHVVDRVRELGLQRVDGIVLTHDSLDHRGGFEQALASLQPRWVARPRAAPGPWQRIVDTAPRLLDVCAGDGFDVGAARVEVLHPRCDGTITPRTGDLHNDGAMVLLISHGNVRAVVPADAEAPVLVGLDLPPLDLLRISHHGSADPQLPQLLEQVAPAAAAISVGEGNDYGHPRREVLDHLAAADVLVRRTDRDGTIEFRSDANVLSIVEEGL